MLVVTACLPFAALRILKRFANFRDAPLRCCVLAYNFSVVASCFGSIGFNVSIDLAIGLGRVIVARASGGVDPLRTVREDVRPLWMKP